ncbi:MAG TPA: GNAT family N-acetyltransferase [Verrucomicrobiota bacterium]|nr:GNAT family N-acetyltransferase [Verrucomicrobiota bacterium]
MQVRSPVTEADFDSYYDLRWRALRAPWGQPRGSERDELDAIATHVAGFDEAKRMVSVGRLHLVSPDVGQVRYMAVEKLSRGQGHGQTLLAELENKAKRQGVKRLVLDARESAVTFYLRNGYEIEGEAHVLFDEVQHSKMQKLLLL